MVREQRKARTIIADPRALMLIDEANIHAAIARNENRQINWEELRDFVASRGGRALTRELEACILFVGMPPDFGPHRADRERRARFYRKLQSLGFTIIKREGIPAPGGRFKANVDVLMTVEGMKLVLEKKPDVLILVTADNDFSPLCQWAHEAGITVEVAHLEDRIGRRLEYVCDYLLDLRPLINAFPRLRPGEDDSGSVSETKVRHPAPELPLRKPPPRGTAPTVWGMGISPKGLWQQEPIQFDWGGPDGQEAWYDIQDKYVIRQLGLDRRQLEKHGIVTFAAVQREEVETFLQGYLTARELAAQAGGKKPPPGGKSGKDPLNIEDLDEWDAFLKDNFG